MPSEKEKLCNALSGLAESTSDSAGLLMRDLMAKEIGGTMAAVAYIQALQDGINELGDSDADDCERLILTFAAYGVSQVLMENMRCEDLERELADQEAPDG